VFSYDITHPEVDLFSTHHKMLFSGSHLILVLHLTEAKLRKGTSTSGLASENRSIKWPNIVFHALLGKWSELIEIFLITIFIQISSVG
jgi:hypothetical protein